MTVGLKLKGDANHETFSVESMHEDQVCILMENIEIADAGHLIQKRGDKIHMVGGECWAKIDKNHLAKSAVVRDIKPGDQFELSE